VDDKVCELDGRSAPRVEKGLGKAKGGRKPRTPVRGVTAIYTEDAGGISFAPVGKGGVGGGLSEEAACFYWNNGGKRRTGAG